MLVWLALGCETQSSHFDHSKLKIQNIHNESQSQRPNSSCDLKKIVKMAGHRQEALWHGACGIPHGKLIY